VLLTTHSPGFAAELPTESIRFVTRDDNGNPRIDAGVDVFDQVAQALGVVADSRIKVLLCVEGPTDVTAFKCLSHALHLDDPSIPDLSGNGSVAFIVLGGSTLQHWVAEHYLKALGRPEVHIYDSDVATYGASVAAVNQRTDGSWGVQTTKHEIESYLHSDAIKDAFGVEFVVPDHCDANGCAVPALFSTALFAANPVGKPINDGTAKKRLAAKAFVRMTAARIKERDPAAEVEGWFRRIGAML